MKTDGYVLDLDDRAKTVLYIVGMLDDAKQRGWTSGGAIAVAVKGTAALDQLEAAGWEPSDSLARGCLKFLGFAPSEVPVVLKIVQRVQQLRREAAKELVEGVGGMKIPLPTDHRETCGKQGCGRPATVRGYKGSLSVWACPLHAAELE